MTTGYRIYDQHSLYFVTFTIVDWIDIFTRRAYKDVIIESLAFCIREKGLLVFGYVIMSNHLHLLLKVNGDIPLSDIIRDFKKFTARRIIELIRSEPESRREWLLHRFRYNAGLHQRNSDHQVWTHDNHAIEIRSAAFFQQKLNYIHNNPVRAGWVDFAEDYVYCSAYEIAGRGDKIDISYWL